MPGVFLVAVLALGLVLLLLLALGLDDDVDGSPFLGVPRNCITFS